MYDKYKALYDKRSVFVQQRKALLDKAIRAERLLTSDEETENERLRVEIAKMDQLIDHCRLMPDSDGRTYGPFGELGGGPIERGQSGDFQPTGYTTEHRGLAEFIRDVAYPTERRVMAMSVGATGGFLIPDQLLGQILQAPAEDAAISPRATTIAPFEGAPDAPTLIPTLDQSGGKGILGGIDMTWLAEGAAKPEVQPELKQVRLEPQEIAGHVVLTDKLLRNGGAELDIFLRRTLSSSLVAAQEVAFLSGTGIGQPLGILNSPCRIEVARTAPGALAYTDLVNMVAVFGPNCWARGFWLVAQSALPALLMMADPGAGGTLVLRPSDTAVGRPPSILGLPLVVSGRNPTLGATGDVMLLEPSYYLRKLGFGPSIEISNGPRFVQNQSVLKIFANVDGQPWLTTPVLMENGVDQVSPFVILAA